MSDNSEKLPPFVRRIKGISPTGIEGNIDTSALRQAVEDGQKALRIANLVYDLIKDDLPDSEKYRRRFLEELGKIVFPGGPDAAEKKPSQPGPGISYAALRVTKIPFGQYNGCTFDEVPMGYLDWLCRENEEFHRDLRDYLRHPETRRLR